MLFEPLQIAGVQLKNRLAISPMCQYSSADGFANEWHLVHLGSRVIGGAGLIIQEATAVSPEGRITAADMGLWKDEQIGPLKIQNAFIKSNGTVPGIQLAHAGRKASTAIPWRGGHSIPLNDGGWKTLAPSPIPFRATDQIPAAMSLQQIDRLKDDFKSAALRALEAGFELIEIHAAHGYLIHSFLSPLSNQRDDLYGGSFENRIRLILEIVSVLRQSLPSAMPLFVRISATDYQERGWDIEDSVQLAFRLKDAGVDLIDVSSGGLVSQVKIPLGPGYQVPFAERIKKETGIRTAAVGLITDALQANEIIEAGKADLVLIARESLRDPYFPLRAARALDADLSWPVQYERAKK